MSVMKHEMKEYAIRKVADLASKHENDRGEIENWLAAERIISVNWDKISKNILQWRDSVNNQEEFDNLCGGYLWKQYKKWKPIHG